MLLVTNGDLRLYEDTGTTPSCSGMLLRSRLGIGDSSPDGILDVEGSITIAGSQAGVIFNPSVTPANNNVGSVGLVSGTLNAPASTNASSKISGLRVAPTTSGSFNGAGEIAGIKVETFNGQSATLATGLYVDAPTGGDVNYAAILNGGNVGIGTTAPESITHIKDTGNVSTTLQIESAASQYAPVINFDGIVGASADYLLGEINGSWDTHTNVVSAIRFESGADTTNKDDGLISFWTSSSGPTLTERMRIDSSGNLAVANGNQTAANVSSRIMFGNKGTFTDSGVGRAEICGVSEGALWYSGTALAFYTNPGPDVTGTAPTERMRIDASGNVGIGESSPAEKLEVAGNILLNASNAEVNLRSGATGTSGAINWTFNTDTTDFASIKLAYDDRNTTGLHIDSGYPITLDASGSGTIFAQSGNEKARIDASGNLLVSDTTANPSGDNVDSGIALHSGGLVRASTNNAAAPLDLNVKGRDGDIAVFRKDGTTVGSIGARQGDLIVGTGDTGVQFYDVGNAIFPINVSTGGNRDAAIDLGESSNRFKDLYTMTVQASTGTASAPAYSF